MVESAIPRGRLARIRKAQNRASPPPDFEDFWLDTLDELISVAPRVRSSALPSCDAHSVIATDVDSFDGVRVRCWLSGPRRAGFGGERRPLLVTSHGYGGQMEPERIRRLSAFGFDVVGVDARGFGLSRDDIPGISPYGYVLTGCVNQHQSILRGAVCDFIQAYRAARKWFGVPSQVTFQGFSFAGGISTMAASVLSMGYGNEAARSWLPPPDILAMGVPTFGFFEKRLQQCEAGSGKEIIEYLRQHPERRHALARMFSYFDTTNFAPYLGNGEGDGVLPRRIIAGVGAYDPVVPPETVYAILNALPRKPEVFEMPCSHTARPEEAEWVRWESAWIRACRGIDPVRPASRAPQSDEGAPESEEMPCDDGVELSAKDGSAEPSSPDLPEAHQIH